MCKYTEIPHNPPLFIDFFSKKLLTKVLISTHINDYQQNRISCIWWGICILQSQNVQLSHFSTFSHSILPSPILTTLLFSPTQRGKFIPSTQATSSIKNLPPPLFYRSLHFFNKNISLFKKKVFTLQQITLSIHNKYPLKV